MSSSQIKVVDTDNIDEQLPDLLQEMLSGSGAIIIKDAFPTEMISEARDLIHQYTIEEDDKETHSGPRGRRPRSASNRCCSHQCGPRWPPASRCPARRLDLVDQIDR